MWIFLQLDITCLEVAEGGGESFSTHPQKQAESTGVGLRSKMSQETLSLERFYFYI